MDRRKLLALLGGSVTVSLAGCLGDDDDDDDDPNGDDTGADDDNGTDDPNGGANGDDDNGEPDLDPAEFVVGLSDIPGSVASDVTELTGAYSVENVGDEEGTQDLVVHVDDEQVVSEETTLDGGEDTTGEFLQDIDVAIGDIIDVSVASDDTEASETVQVVGPDVEEFVAESTGGFLAVGEETEADAREEGFGLPPDGEIDDPIQIDGIAEDGQWESTRVDFPDLDADDLLGEELGDLPLEVDIQVEAPDGFSGEIDRVEGLMTVDGALRILGFLGQDPEEPQLTVEIELNGTTAESGSLTGSFDGSDDPILVTVVDNETPVDALPESDEDLDEGGELTMEESLINPIVNDELNLPSESGETWMEIDFEVSFDE